MRQTNKHHTTRTQVCPFRILWSIKEAFGVTLLEYVNGLKLNHATYLLKTTHYTLAEICEQIGIESMPYFIKIFTQKYGMTPAKYRKNHTK